MLLILLRCVLEELMVSCKWLKNYLWWPPGAKSQLIREDLDAGKDWGQEEKGLTEDEMVDGVTDSMDMVWVDSKSWWWTGRPGVLQSMGSQRVGHDWATELNWGIKDITNETCIAQETLLNGLQWPKWKESQKKRKYMYTYDWFTLLYKGN